MGAVRDIDNGANAMVRRLGMARRARKVVDVGILGAQAGEPHKDEDGGTSDATLGEIASYHELGIGQVPRPFIRGYVDANISQIENRIRIETRRLLTGKNATTEIALERLGVWLQGEIQGWLANPGNSLEPLAPETILRKKSAMVLIDTGQLRSAIAYAVRRRSEGL